MDFSQVAAESRKLKTQYDAGALSETDFKARLQDLMIEDELGRWWMIGYETGQWYVHDGEGWVRKEPDRAASQPASTPGPVIKFWPVLLIGAAISVLVGWAIGAWVYWGLFSDFLTTGEVTGRIAALAATLSGMFVTAVLADLARREKGLPLSLVARTLAIWLICMALACGLGWLFCKAFANPEDFSGEAMALIAGCIVGIGGSLYLVRVVRRDRHSRHTEKRP
jgi:hypothetical protein